VSHQLTEDNAAAAPGSRQILKPFLHLDLSSYRRTICAATSLAFVAGCSASQPIGVPGALSTQAPPIGGTDAIPEQPPFGAHVEADGSWMLPEAKGDDLLYVTNLSWVNVFSYPEGKLKGILTKFNSAVGDCVDKSGDVFITNQMPPALYEYAHGGSKRIATLHVPKAAVEPVGCSIDPTTGNLAVSGFSHGVEIFNNARGNPTFYRDKQFYGMDFCAYDDKGNLFINGFAKLQRDGIVELPKGAKNFAAISTATRPYPVSGIQWFGGRLAVGGYKRGTFHPVIYQYALHGQKATLTGTVSLGSPAYEVFQFLINGSSVIVPNWAKHGDRLYSVLAYDYPTGGAPLSEFMQRLDHPRGVVLSLAETAAR
jgi:hypothetical protein